MIAAEGLEAVYDGIACSAAPPARPPRARARHARRPDENANVVTAIVLPDSIDGAKVPKLMRDRFGITIAGGQGHLKGKIAASPTAATSANSTSSSRWPPLEMTLRELGHDLELGAGVAAAQRVFLEAGVPVAAPA